MEAEARRRFPRDPHDWPLVALALVLDVVDEPASSRLAARLDRAVDSDDALISSLLLETELRQLAVCVDLTHAVVTHLLERFDVVEGDRSLYREAGLLPGRYLRSRDHRTARPGAIAQYAVRR